MTLFLQALTEGVINGLAYSLMAAGLTMVFGVGKVINFAHGELYTLGAYLAIVFVQTRLPYPLALVVSIVLVGAVGILLETGIMRRLVASKGIWAPFLGTFALSSILQSVYLIIFGPDPYILNNPFAYTTINISSITIMGQDVIIAIVSVISIALLSWFLRGTKYGIAIRAVSQDKDAALLMGIDTNRINQLTWFLGALLAALAGALITPESTVDPYIGLTPLLIGLCIVIVGGLGSVEGAVLAGIILGLVESMAATYLSPDFKDAFGYLLLIFILLIRPSGLLGKSLRRG